MSEPKIVYPQEFKEKVFNNLRYAVGDIRLLMSAIDRNLDNVVRYIIEKTLEDSELFVTDQIQTGGVRKIAESKVHAYRIRQEIYSEYMELLMLTLDKHDVRRIELLR